ADKCITAIWDMGDPKTYNILGGAAEEGLAVKPDLAAEPNHPAERAQCRRLAGSIGAEQRHDVAFVEREIEAVKSLVLTVKRTQLAHFEHHWTGARGLPR